MESAIPRHLQRPRTRQARIGESYQPVGQAMVPCFAESVTEVSVAYLGLQWRTVAHVSAAHTADAAQAWLMAQLQAKDGPCYYERAEFCDPAGFTNRLFVCYWLGNGFGAWWQRIGYPWTRDAALFPDLGLFAEVFQPTMDRAEAITDGAPLHGLAQLAGEVRGPVMEQGYWGAMRDRIPLSQTDAMRPAGGFRQVVDGSLVTVEAPTNLCIIRTGQDWSAGELEEKTAYLEKIEPAMQDSMALLDTSGLQLGCLCNRYAWLLDSQGRKMAATFGFSIWRSLTQLELWAETHFKHLALYVGAIRHAEYFGAATRFSRYHEVLVPAAQQVFFEYRNCHGQTGVLEAVE